jgi:hypothetical protein
MIPILPMNMIEILEAPFPYFVGVQPNPSLETLEIENEVIRVDLDQGQIYIPDEQLQQSLMPSLPFKESKMLK